VKRRPYQQIASKAVKTKVLMENERILPYLPETKWYHRRELMNMLQKHGAVFIKPDKGGGGRGAIKVALHGNAVECQDLFRRKILPKSEAISWVESRLQPGKKYIMQQAIRLATISKRPFDLRVLIQKPESDWKISGICAKVAAPGKIVTNFCKGGRPLEAEKALAIITHPEKSKAKALLAELTSLSKEIAKTLNQRFTGLKELGVDAGVDRQGRIWIFEVNTRPNFKMFRVLPNKKIYRKICDYHHQIVQVG